MNILPKKRWHVRTKQNIERVRRDEAKAAEEEKERQRRVLLAEQEARTSLLRKRAREATGVDESALVQQGDKAQHVNFFTDVEEGKKTHGTNKEHEIEKREEQEKFEKSIGLLTYLGQDCAEEKDIHPWYFNPPSRKMKLESEQEKTIESSKKSKSFHDPLKIMHQYLGSSQSDKKPEVAGLPKPATASLPPLQIESRKKHKSKKKKKKHKKERRSEHVSSSGKTLDQLRAERLQREKAERLRSEQLLRRLRGEPAEAPKETVVHEQRYNSQYNPHLAR